MTAMLAIDRLTITVHDRALVSDASFSASGMTALVGPNGAGKSTLLRAIVGLTTPAGGSITLDGTNLLSLGRRDRARLVSFVEQSATTEERLNVEDVVALGRIPFRSVWQPGSDDEDDDIVRQSLADVGLSAFAKLQFATLSGGEQQRVLLARALAQQPRLLVLDEPTSHLDIAAQMLVLDLLRHKSRSGLIVLLALHDLNLAATFCNSVVVLHDGAVKATGAPADVLTPALLGEVYEVSATLLRHPRTGRTVIAYEPRNSD